MEIKIYNTYRLVISFKDCKENIFLERSSKLNIYLSLIRPPRVFKNPEDISTEVFGTETKNDAWTREVFESPKGILEVASVYLSMTSPLSFVFTLR